MNQIRSENEKFWLLKMSLEPETYQQVTGFIHNPPESGKYQALKKAIIKTHTDSETKRIKSLLNDMVLGERRPTQLLAEMSNLYRGPRDRIFAEIFVSRLPPTVRGILSGMQTNAPETSLETLAQWADAIMEQTESTKTITQINEVEKTERIERALSQLANRVDRIQSGARNESWVPLEYRQERGRPTNSTPHRPAAQPQQPPKVTIHDTSDWDDLVQPPVPPPIRVLTDSRRGFSVERHDTCFYHRTFGRDSHTCRPPCRLAPKN